MGAVLWLAGTDCGLLGVGLPVVRGGGWAGSRVERRRRVVSDDWNVPVPAPAWDTLCVSSEKHPRGAVCDPFDGGEKTDTAGHHVFVLGQRLSSPFFLCLTRRSCTRHNTKQF